MVSFFIFGEHHKVSAGIAFVGRFVKVFVCHIHLAAKNRLENFILGSFLFGFGFGRGCLIALFAGFGKCFFGLLYLFFYGAVFLVHIIEKFFGSEHIAVVGKSEAFHAVCYRFVHEGLD